MLAATARSTLIGLFPRAAKWFFLAYAIVCGMLVSICIFALAVGTSGNNQQCPSADYDFSGFCRFLLLHQGDVAGALFGSLNEMNGGGNNAMIANANVSKDGML